jgi:hypothetical protein
MSKILTLSLFYFGTTVTINNRSIDFDEGAGELYADLKVGDYSLTEYAAEVQRALRLAGSQAYTVTFNRASRTLTIAAPLAFDLLVSSGSRLGTSAWAMMGFTGADLTGLLSYEGDEGAGEEYQTQHPVNNYLASKDSRVKEQATVNSTPSGITQMINFGDSRRISMNIRLITDLTGVQNLPFFDNANGVDDFRNFMDYLLTKVRVEFMEDVDVRTTC